MSLSGDLGSFEPADSGIDLEPYYMFLFYIVTSFQFWFWRPSIGICMVERDFSIGETHKGEWDLNSPLEARGLD